MMTPDLDDLDEKEDSPDLTDPEIEGAIPVDLEAELAGKISTTLSQCSVCGKGLVKYRYVLRRRQPHMYWRVTGMCGEHENTILFRADWIRGG